MTLEGEQDILIIQEQLPPWRTRWIPRLMNSVYMGVLTFVNLVFSIFLIVADFMLIWKVEYFKLISGLALFINAVYFLDMVMNFVVLGPKNVWKSKTLLYLELVVQALFICYVIRLFV